MLASTKAVCACPYIERTRHPRVWHVVISVFRYLPLAAARPLERISRFPTSPNVQLDDCHHFDDGLPSRWLIVEPANGVRSPDDRPRFPSRPARTRPRALRVLCALQSLGCDQPALVGAKGSWASGGYRSKFAAAGAERLDNSCRSDHLRPRALVTAGLCRPSPEHERQKHQRQAQRQTVADHQAHDQRAELVYHALAVKQHARSPLSGPIACAIRWLASARAQSFAHPMTSASSSKYPPYR